MWKKNEAVERKRGRGEEKGGRRNLTYQILKEILIFKKIQRKLLLGRRSSLLEIGKKLSPLG